MATTAQIILVRLDDNGSAYYRVGSNQLHLSILDVEHGNAILPSLNISQITNHSLLIIRSTVVSAKGVEDASSRSESLGKITEDVDVKSVLAL